MPGERGEDGSMGASLDAAGGILGPIVGFGFGAWYITFGRFKYHDWGNPAGMGDLRANRDHTRPLL